MMGFRLGRAATDRLLPMHVVVEEGGRVVHAGPALRKIAARNPAGAPIGALLRFTRPYAAADAFGTLADKPLQVEILGAGGIGGATLPMRAVLVPLPQGGALIHLAPGVRLSKVVRDHGLDANDFSPVDASVDLLFMLEAQTLVRAEVQRLGRLAPGELRAADPIARLPAGPPEAQAELDRGADAGAEPDPSGPAETRACGALARLAGGGGFGLLRVDVGDGAGEVERADAITRISDAAAAVMGDGDVAFRTPTGVVLTLHGCRDGHAVDAVRRRLEEGLATTFEGTDGVIGVGDLSLHGMHVGQGREAHPHSARDRVNPAPAPRRDGPHGITGGAEGARPRASGSDEHDPSIGGGADASRAEPASILPEWAVALADDAPGP